MVKKTKIVATIGPSCDTPEMVKKLIELGVNVFRFNFKHGELEWHRERLRMVKQVAHENGYAIGTLIDLQGPSFRLLTPSEQIELTKGELIPLVKNLSEAPEKALSVSHPHILDHLEEGQKILAEDGSFTFFVRKKDEGLFLEVETPGILKQRRNMNIPGADFPCDLLIERDYEGIKLAAEEKADFIALSFVRSAQDVHDVREEARRQGSFARICSKIETQKAINELDDIVQASDAVMVARGDLGVELPIEQVPFYQKRIIKTCIEYAVPVITATQMMQSMVEAPSPTRAEISDVANAVYDQTDAVMLSAESATGKYPAETIGFMARTLAQHEEYGKEFMVMPKEHSITDMEARICDAANRLYEDYLKAQKPLKGFLVFTSSGRTARLVSRYRPGIPIFTFTSSQEVADALTLSYGVWPFIQDELKDTDVDKDDVLKAVEYLKQRGLIEVGSKLIVLHGDKWGQEGGTSTIRVVNVK